MPSFRVTGDYRVAFIISVEAQDAADAEDLVSQMRLAQLRLGLEDFDTTVCPETTIDGVVELDENGDEIEEENDE